MTPTPTVKGTVPFGAYKTWYRITDKPGADRPPIVVLHGGPGSTHDYLVRLASLVEEGWPVVHYDQLGNGGSTHLRDNGPEFWTPELFLDELDNLLSVLDIEDEYILFGHSWGGVLAAAHAVRKPAGLVGLVIADSPASYPLWLSELDELRMTLPLDVETALREHEAAGTTDSKEYEAASKVFYQRHVCRLPVVPRELAASFIEIKSDPTVYRNMNGPNEFHIVGTLKDYSLVDSLPSVEAPTLVLHGEHDEITPAATAPFHELIPGARYEVIPDSSHLPHLENKTAFDAVLLEFLKGL